VVSVWVSHGVWSESGSVMYVCGLSLGQSCLCDRGGDRIGLQATGSYVEANILEGRAAEVLNNFWLLEID